MHSKKNKIKVASKEKYNLYLLRHYEKTSDPFVLATCFGLWWMEVVSHL